VCTSSHTHTQKHAHQYIDPYFSVSTMAMMSAKHDLRSISNP